MANLTILTQMVGLTEARRIVGEPRADDSPQLRRLAWLILKTNSGHPARQVRTEA